MSQPQTDPSRGHSRNKSAAKAARPRSSTKGPLDIGEAPLNDPLSASHAQPESSGPKRVSGQSSPGLRSPIVSSPPSAVPTSMRKDFSFLLRPDIYHPLTPVNVPAAFRNSPKQPSPDAPLADLLGKGHFRAAAVAAVQELTSSAPQSSAIDPSDHERIFGLLYTRLACLTLIEATNLAAQEVRAFGDLNNASIYVDDATGEHLVPWELRVLNVRLQAIGFGDPRRSVMSFHDLAREARDQIGKAAARHDNSAREMWKARLHELGIKVAGALIEMDDLSGAAHHLGTLRDHGDGKLALSRALLWLHLGDVGAARQCVRGVAEEDGRVDLVVAALCDMADGEYGPALKRWEALKEDGHHDEMVGVNTAVCLLYTGNMDQGRELLEQMVGAAFSSHTLLFNLSTMYELCTERNKALKTRLTERVAGFEETSRGWEKTNADFKL